ncbi:hypothetical protein [Vibrio maerlii]|uniref:hypothetical protein n=1 Tax=Vibrio maerlii TaxID=2231648 RepID=UPI000E3D41C8|nr:hypothetical protein [Vibrio maerlii]
MAVKELKLLRRQYNSGEIRTEEELHHKIQEFYANKRSDRFGMAKVVFSQQPNIVKKIQADEFESGAIKLYEDFKSRKLRPIDYRYYFECAKQGSHIIMKAQEVFGDDFEVFEAKAKLEIERWLNEKVLTADNIVHYIHSQSEAYANSYYKAFFLKVLNKSLARLRPRRILVTS